MFSFHRLVIWTVVLFVVIGFTPAHAGQMNAGNDGLKHYTATLDN